MSCAPRSLLRHGIPAGPDPSRHSSRLPATKDLLRMASVAVGSPAVRWPVACHSVFALIKDNSHQHDICYATPRGRVQQRIISIEMKPGSIMLHTHASKFPCDACSRTLFREGSRSFYRWGSLANGSGSSLNLTFLTIGYLPLGLDFS